MSTFPAVYLLAAVLAQPADLPPIIKEYSRIGTFYYQNPDPKVGPKMLKELLKKENLEHQFFVKRDDVAGLLAHRSATSERASRRSFASMNRLSPTHRRPGGRW